MKRHTEANARLREWLLREISQNHRGIDRAIPWPELARSARAAGFAIGQDERNLREEANSLQEAGALIVTSTRPPWGVYYAENRGEAESYLADLYSRIEALNKKAGFVRANIIREFEEQQLPLI